MIHKMTKEALSGRVVDQRVYVVREPEELEEFEDRPDEYDRPPIYPVKKQGPGDDDN